jgi:hypothetical protein
LGVYSRTTVPSPVNPGDSQLCIRTTSVPEVSHIRPGRPTEVEKRPIKKEESCSLLCGEVDVPFTNRNLLSGSGHLVPGSESRLQPVERLAWECRCREYKPGSTVRRSSHTRKTFRKKILLPIDAAGLIGVKPSHFISSNDSIFVIMAGHAPMCPQP